MMTLRRRIWLSALWLAMDFVGAVAMLVGMIIVSTWLIICAWFVQVLYATI